MIKSELVEKLADENPHLFQRDIENIVNAILDEVGDAMARGDRVELRGFGAFSVKNRPARVGRNPRTGEQVDVGEKYVPQFKAGKEIRERLNQALRTARPGTADQMIRRIVGWFVLVPLCAGADRVRPRQPPARGRSISIRLAPSEALGDAGFGVPLFLVMFARAAGRRAAGRRRHLVRPGPHRRDERHYRRETERLQPRARSAAPRARRSLAHRSTNCATP